MRILKQCSSGGRLPSIKVWGKGEVEMLFALLSDCAARILPETCARAVKAASLHQRLNSQ